MARPSQDEPRIDQSQFLPLPMTTDIGSFAEFNSRNVTAALRASEAAFTGATACWLSAGAFLSKRLRADADAVRALASARSGEDAARTQQQFLSTMIADYADELHSMLSLGAEIAHRIADIDPESAADEDAEDQVEDAEDDTASERD